MKFEVCYIWYKSTVTTLVLNRLNTKPVTENRKLTSTFILVKFSYKHQREEELRFVGSIENVEMSTEKGCRPENPLNNEQGNLRDGELRVDLNDI